MNPKYPATDTEIKVIHDFSSPKINSMLLQKFCIQMCDYHAVQPNNFQNSPVIQSRSCSNSSLYNKGLT